MMALLKDVDKNILCCSRQNGRQQKIEPAILRRGSNRLKNNRPLLHLAIAGRVVLIKILNTLNKYV